eukprot:TRINITY_DN39793_c0_g1_i1.p2 TRINITY_DN39793_c0_g1~~TRINITY_DN39793_c0_g1_i1.p2  ORF type:complete len:100 (+),score=4.02 TRINITY_DN39793_c0_g1_i1:313-612(+)
MIGPAPGRPHKAVHMRSAGEAGPYVYLLSVCICLCGSFSVGNKIRKIHCNLPWREANPWKFRFVIFYEYYSSRLSCNLIFETLVKLNLYPAILEFQGGT